MKTNSNKGMFLESIINKSNEYYFLNKIAYIEKYATPIKICKVEQEKVVGKLYKKSNVDYFGIYNKKFICFEAKQTSDDLFYLRCIKEHQINYMKTILNFGGDSWIILFFNKTNRFFKIDIKKILNTKLKFIDVLWCEKNSKELFLIFPGRIDFLR